MTGSVLLGWAMTVIGVLFLLLAFAAAGKNVLQKGAGARESTSPPGGLADVLKYFAQVLQELARLPLWIACLLAGLVLIFLGQRLANGQSLPGI